MPLARPNPRPAERCVGDRYEPLSINRLPPPQVTAVGAPVVVATGSYHHRRFWDDGGACCGKRHSGGSAESVGAAWTDGCRARSDSTVAPTRARAGGGI